ncbi:hypothetical protein [Natronomonas sp. LN261]|jgi:hypothetical protein|uniref:hypothetical protein n=1 Tax=Natronomonas sp. LN261 TaxID=2750669 RepID=UPI0015EF97A6|nr:hypothetical protein [Natronomonas sp. LN261]
MRFLQTAVDLPGWVSGVLLLAGTISTAGLTDYLLTSTGYGTLGTAVWAVCYAGALATVWVVWLRDLELTGPESG